MSRNTPSRPDLPPSRWRMLLVDDRGRLVTLRWLRMLGWLFGLLVVGAAATAVVFFLLYRHSDARGRSLEDRVATLQGQVASMRQEREQLLARLAVAEARIEKLSGAAQPPKASGARGAAADPVPAEKREPVSKQPPTAANPTPDSQPAARPVRRIVTVEDFLLSRKSGANLLDFRFKLVNVDEDPGPVSGYSFVLLKPDAERPDTWLSLPHASLEHGRPYPVDKGRAFSIARFKTVEFSALIERDVEEFRSATVLVFENEGDLLFEKSYPTPWAGSGDSIGDG